MRSRSAALAGCLLHGPRAGPTARVAALSTANGYQEQRGGYTENKVVLGGIPDWSPVGPKGACTVGAERANG
jgi:hypothetical protein